MMISYKECAKVVLYLATKEGKALLWDKGLDLFVIVVGGLLIAVLTYVVFDRKIRPYHRAMEAFGIQNFSSSGEIPKHKVKELFLQCRCVCVCVTSGYKFFHDSINRKIIEKALENGTKIKVLMAQKGSRFIEENDIMEMKYGNRTRSINEELEEMYALFAELEKRGDIEYRTFDTMFRHTFFLGKKSERERIAWFNIFIPPLKAAESKLFYAETKNSYEYTIIDNLDTYFSQAWEMYAQEADNALGA